MPDQKLNRLAVRYRETGDEDVFREIYELLNTGWFRKQMEQDFRRHPNDRHEVIALYDDSLLSSLESFKDNFAHYLKVTLKNGRSRLKKRLARRGMKEVSLEAIEEARESGEGAPPPPPELRLKLPESPFRPDNQVLEKEKARIQRHLISELAAQADGFTKRVLNNFHRCDSITALATALGVHHSKVSRSLHRLARNYDYSRFGDIRDLLA